MISRREGKETDFPLEMRSPKEDGRRNSFALVALATGAGRDSRIGLDEEGAIEGGSSRGNSRITW